MKDLVEEVKEVKRIVSNIWDFLANQRPPLPALSEPQSVCQSPPPLPPPLQLTTEFPPLSQHSPFTENSPGMSHCVCLTFQPLVPRPVYNCLPLNSLQTALPVPLSTCQAPPPVHVTQPPPLCQLSGFAENSLGILCIAFDPLLHCLIAIAYLLILYSCVSSSKFSDCLMCSAGSFSFMYCDTFSF